MESRSDRFEEEHEGSKYKGASTVTNVKSTMQPKIISHNNTTSNTSTTNNNTPPPSTNMNNVNINKDSGKSIVIPTDDLNKRSYLLKLYYHPLKKILMTFKKESPTLEYLRRVFNDMRISGHGNVHNRMLQEGLLTQNNYGLENVFMIRVLDINGKETNVSLDLFLEMISSIVASHERQMRKKALERRNWRMKKSDDDHKDRMDDYHRSRSKERDRDYDRDYIRERDNRDHDHGREREREFSRERYQERDRSFRDRRDQRDTSDYYRSNVMPYPQPNGHVGEPPYHGHPPQYYDEKRYPVYPPKVPPMYPPHLYQRPPMEYPQVQYGMRPNPKHYVYEQPPVIPPRYYEQPPSVPQKRGYYVPTPFDDDHGKERTPPANSSYDEKYPKGYDRDRIYNNDPIEEKSGKFQETRRKSDRNSFPPGGEIHVNSVPPTTTNGRNYDERPYYGKFPDQVNPSQERRFFNDRKPPRDRFDVNTYNDTGYYQEREETGVKRRREYPHSKDYSPPKDYPIPKEPFPSKEFDRGYGPTKDYQN